MSNPLYNADWGYSSLEWMLTVYVSLRKLVYRPNLRSSFVEFSQRQNEVLSFLRALKDLENQKALLQTSGLDIEPTLDVRSSGQRVIDLTLKLNDTAWATLVPNSYIYDGKEISTPTKFLNKLLDFLRTIEQDRTGNNPPSSPGGLKPIEASEVNFKLKDSRGPGDPKKTTLSRSGELDKDSIQKAAKLLSDFRFTYSSEFANSMSPYFYDDYLRYTSNPSSQDMQIERLRISQNDVIKRTDEQTIRINELSATCDRLSKQQEEVLKLLREINEKKAKGSAAADSDDEEGNPFASPYSDGKGQMEMLLRGLMTPRVSLDQVIMPDNLRTKILAVINQQHHANTLFGQWGFAETLEKGKGMTLLFAGVPGTGKTMTAEAIAKHLGYDFWNIKSGNLDGMFVGDFEKAVTYAFRRAREAPMRYAEWEQMRDGFIGDIFADNPNAIFGIRRPKENEYKPTLWSIYEQGGVYRNKPWEYWQALYTKEFASTNPAPPKGIVLMFDEADSIVTARDNKEAGYALGPIKVGQINHILGELEEFDGVVIFATNRVVTLDEALQSRISLIAEFPFPDQQMREQIWRRLIPTKAPLAPDVDFSALAKHEIAGRHIKNAVLNAARTAAQEQAEAITQTHLLSAIRDQLHGGDVFHGKRPKFDVRAIYGDNEMMARIFTGHDNSLWN